MAPKRSAEEIQREMQQAGAIFLRFNANESRNSLDLFHGRKGEIPEALLPSEIKSNDDKHKHIKVWKNMEQHCFLVVSDHGCMVPAIQHCASFSGSDGGHQASAAWFGGIGEIPRPVGSETEPMVDEDDVFYNEDAWPLYLQISHLCHRRACCNPLHLVCEEAWRNRKRNYCGSSGSCDCGNAVKCIRKFTPSARDKKRDGAAKVEWDKLAQSSTQVLEDLVPLIGNLPGLNLSIETPGTVSRENAKRSKRNEERRAAAREEVKALNFDEVVMVEDDE